jgi:hypothetical protein
MPSYVLPYPKGKSQHDIKHKPSPLQTGKAKQPYPHPQPDPPNNPPSPLNLSFPSSSLSASSSSSSSSSSSTIKPTPAKNRHQDYHPSALNLQIVFGNPHDPSLIVVFGLKFREGRRPKVKFSVKRGHGRTREIGDVLGVENEGEDGRKEERRGRERSKAQTATGKKRKRDSEN